VETEAELEAKLLKAAFFGRIAGYSRGGAAAEPAGAAAAAPTTPEPGLITRAGSQPTSVRRPSRTGSVGGAEEAEAGRLRSGRCEITVGHSISASVSSDGGQFVLQRGLLRGGGRRRE